MKGLKVAWLVLLSVFLVACQNEQSANQIEFSDQPALQGEEIYILGVHPLHNPTKLVSVYGPLADYLSQHLPGIEVRIEASRDYPSYDDKIERQAFHLSLPNPFQTINSFAQNYEVINQVGEQSLFKGLILVRKDSPIKDVSDLKGQKIAYPAPTALAATMMPQYFLKTQGLKLEETQTMYVGSQESSIMNVYFKHTQASATWPVPWLDLQKNQPEIAEQLRVAWETETLPNNSFMYHKDKVPKPIALKIQGLLADLHNHQTGRALLEAMNVSRIFVADNATYEPVKGFITKFRQEIGDNAKLASLEPR